MSGSSRQLTLKKGAPGDHSQKDQKTVFSRPIIAQSRSKILEHSAILLTFIKLPFVIT